MSVDYGKVQQWAARRLSEQQIADVMEISLDELRLNRNEMRLFREAIRKGRSKGEAELRDALYRQAKKGNPLAYTRLMAREKKQGGD